MKKIMFILAVAFAMAACTKAPQTAVVEDTDSVVVEVLDSVAADTVAE